jgi:23S rRNA pseudouridine1911/1915/1917 synthase
MSSQVVTVRHELRVDRGDTGVRLDRVLLRHLLHRPGVTRNRLQRLIAAGAVQVDGRAITKPSARVPEGAPITIDLPERRARTRPVAESLPLDVCYEDADLLIVHKPAGQVSHPAFRQTSGTLLNALLGYAAGQWTPSLVGRLDKDTSGLVLVAKRGEVQTALQRLGDANGIIKEYLAIVLGKPPARGTIDLALDRDPWDTRRVIVRDRGGVPSVTTFQRVRVLDLGGGVWLSLVRCRLITGRTHQIRVHLAARGWPIVGDRAYGTARRTAPTRPGLPPAVAQMRRQALHAWRLAFHHPLTGAPIELSMEPPADMQALLH